MDVNRQPIYLFADSQLLFWKTEGRLFLQTVRDRLRPPSPRAAYIGASNGDAPQFYEIFLAAMNGVGIRDCRHIHASCDSNDAAFLSTADLILLAGGDVEAGWNVLTTTPMAQLVRERHSAGAILIGISAGAVQLGMLLSIKVDGTNFRATDALNLLPYVVDVHDEEQKWQPLDRAVRVIGGDAKGIGIPLGGGLIYHPDGILEAVRLPAYLVSIVDGTCRPETVSIPESRSETRTR